MDKCIICGLSDDYVHTFEGKPYHSWCYQDILDKRELIQAVCKWFGYKRIAPIMYQQIEKYHYENEYTYKGMQDALYYFFGVKKMPVLYNKTLGIIPYIYDEAQQYFIEQNHKKEILMAGIEQQNRVESFSVEPAKQVPRTKVNLNKEWEESDD